MPYVCVDYNNFYRTADTICDYVNSLEQDMSTAENAIVILSNSWHGEDGAVFLDRWLDNHSSESVYSNMKEALKSYEAYLRSIGNIYKNAQSSAIERANWI